MSETASYSILRVKGESLKGSALADRIIALDRNNREAMLREVGRAFPEDRRRITLFHPSNRLIVARKAQEVVGYADYCDDLTDPEDLYLSSIQIEGTHRGGPTFKLLLSNLLIDLKALKFRTIKTNIQKSNPAHDSNRGEDRVCYRRESQKSLNSNRVRKAGNLGLSEIEPSVRFDLSADNSSF